MAQAALGQDFETLKKQFDYDASKPLDYQARKVATEDGVSVYDASFASPMGGRVLCYVVEPEGKGPFGGVVFQHPGSQNRTWFLPDAVRLARAGAVSVLMEAPFNRPEAMRRPIQTEDRAIISRDDMLQVAQDAWRAYDVLAARGDVDPKRIGYVGASFGAMMGGSLAGIDHRFRTFVLIAGLEGFVRHYSTSPHPAMRESLSRQDFAHLLETIGPVDAWHYIGHSSPVPLLFQFARFDPGVSEEDSRNYFKMAGEPKVERWYDSGHDINDPQATADRIEWLRKYLGLRPIPGALDRGK